MLKYRLRPRGFVAFARTAFAQRRHFHSPWSKAVRVAWQHGPIR